MYNTKTTYYIVAGIALIAFLLTGCKSKQTVSPEQLLIMHKCEDLYSRIKVKDYEAIYDNEFPYLHEKMDLEEFLENRYLKWYNPDTLVAVQIDSARIWDGDTAYVYMQLEWLLADSSRSVQPINLQWFKVNDEWIKPTMSALDQEKEYEEELKIYWDAVKEIQEREKQQERGDSL